MCCMLMLKLKIPPSPVVSSKNDELCHGVGVKDSSLEIVVSTGNLEGKRYEESGILYISKLELAINNKPVMPPRIHRPFFLH